MLMAEFYNILAREICGFNLKFLGLQVKDCGQSSGMIWAYNETQNGTIKNEINIWININSLLNQTTWLEI